MRVRYSRFVTGRFKIVEDMFFHVGKMDTQPNYICVFNERMII